VEQDLVRGPAVARRARRCAAALGACAGPRSERRRTPRRRST